MTTERWVSVLNPDSRIVDGVDLDDLPPIFEGSASEAHGALEAGEYKAVDEDDVEVTVVVVLEGIVSYSYVKDDTVDADNDPDAGLHPWYPDRNG